jgi:hypothetical protein
MVLDKERGLDRYIGELIWLERRPASDVRGAAE